MARITSKQAKELMEAYASVHNIQEQNRRVDIKSLDLSKPNGGMSDEDYNALSSSQRNRIQNHMRLNKTKKDMNDAGVKHNEGPSTVSSVNDDATKVQIKRAFIKSLKNKKMNKKILGEFIELVA